MLRRLGLASWLIGILVFVAGLQFAQAQTVDTAQSAPTLVTQGVDEGNLAPLRGNTRPEATPQNDRGAVADGLPMANLLLQLRRSPEQQRALEQFLDEVQDSASPNFHKWLSPQQFGQTFGLAQQDLDAITRWLQSHGFTVNSVYPNRMVIDFSGTAGQVRQAFHTEIHNLDVTGVKHIANMSDPQIPAALAPAIVGIVSLHDFKPRAQHEMRKAKASYTDPTSGTYAVVPADLATIYNLNPLFTAGYSGQGQTIVVIEDTNVFRTSDWSTFRSKFGLSKYTSASFSTVHPAPLSGPTNCANPGVVAGNDGEAIIDAEWASAAAPSAKILLASCADTTTTFGGLIALQNLINAATAPPALVSISYGECETENGAPANAAYSAAYQQAVSEGISVFVSAGDSGAAGCDNNATEATHGIGVNAFASTPYNVAVGGTDFSDTYSGANGIYWNSGNTSTFGSALSYIPEIPWNDSCAGVLLSNYVGSGIPYGQNGFCNDIVIGALFLTTVAGGGGPSACATGSPSVPGVVSGTCQGWPKPSWQSALNNFGNPNDGVRDTPDVSLFAANGLWSHYYVFCWSDTANGGAACTGAPSGWSGAGGTSFAAPIMAGIQALVNQKTGQRQGNPNPAYYQLAATEYNLSSSSCNSANGNGVASSCIFYDITQGDMDVNCTGTNNCYLPSGSEGVLSTQDNSYNPSFGTTTGWDFATGIGSVNAANLVNNWPSSGPSAPPAPTLVSATASSFSEIDLVWTNPAGSNATGNSILRCPGSGCTPATAIASLTATSTTYQDKSVSPLTTYTYLIQATNAGGSTNSNSLTATTPASNQPPSVVSVTPNSGSGLGPQTFTYLYSESSGYQNIYLVQTMLNTTASWPGSCGTMYIAASNSLYLMNDNGDSWLGPLTIGQPGTLQNSQCTLNAGASSASGSGTNLTVKLALTFEPSFTGLKNSFMLAYDVANNLTSGLQNRGTWTPSSLTAPSPVSVTPNSGNGPGPQTFSYLYSDTSGYQNIYLVQMMLNTALSWPSSCGTMYIAPSRSLYLMSDDGSNWMGPLTIGQPGTLQNTQCTLDAGASSASGSGTNLTVNLALTFQTGFTGLKKNFMLAYDAVNNLNSGFQNRGTWTPNPVAAPSAVSVTPSSGSGLGPQTFSYLYSDTFGYQNIYLVQTILNTTLSWPGSCGTMYIAPSGSLYLMSDDGSSWMGPVTIGQPGTLQNSQCTLNAGASSASGSGTTLTVNLVLTFQPGFTGLKNNFMIANDVMNNVTSGLQNRGTWNP
jgi:hypothetical protein